jgi:hypothetical protein
VSYHPNDLEALIEAVEEDRGAQLAEPCVGLPLRFKKPDPKDTSKQVEYTALTCNCAERDDPREARLTIFYFGEDDENRQATVCANCDGVGEWPRYWDVVGVHEGLE